MDDFADLLKFIVPLVIFIGASIFGKSNKQKAQPTHTGHSDFSQILDLLGGETDMGTIPHTVHYQENEQPQQTATPEPAMPEEGVRSVFAEASQATEPEPVHEKPEFDAREAVIYSTILERKY